LDFKGKFLYYTFLGVGGFGWPGIEGFWGTRTSTDSDCRGLPKFFWRLIWNFLGEYFSPKVLKALSLEDLLKREWAPNWERFWPLNRGGLRARFFVLVLTPLGEGILPEKSRGWKHQTKRNLPSKRRILKGLSKKAWGLSQERPTLFGGQTEGL